MSYSIKVIRQKEQSTSNWSGGTTTQIAIYPEEAVYSERNFKWRLSSAKVELEESVFTSLPGIQRLIMVLEGEMKLKHEGHHSVYLKPYEQDSFSGDWTTKSFGRVRDFNLMMAQGCTGEIAAGTIENAATKEIAIENVKPKMTAAFYCLDGDLSIAINGENTLELHIGDLLLINIENPNEKIDILVSNQSNIAVHFIRADIQY